MHFRKFVRAAVAVAITLMAVPFATAGTFSSIIVIGDSLSDNGSLHPTSPPFPYDAGRYSNGPVAVEQLATKLGANLIDFALAGSTTGIGNYGDGGSPTMSNGLPGMAQQFALLQATVPSQLFSNSLFVVWGGPDDFLTGGSAQNAAQNIASYVSALELEGAQHILVPGMPDLGLTPDYAGYAPGTQYAQAFNSFLQQDLAGTDATYFDTFGLLHSIVSNKGSYGLTDVTDPCFNTTALPVTLCSNPSQYLFWDGFHPTTTVDTILANDFAAAVVPTPEPASWLLMGSGVAGFGALVRRTRQKLLA